MNNDNPSVDPPTCSSESMSQSTDFFSHLADSEISGGNFTVTGGDSMFAKSKGLIITGGNFTTSGRSRSCVRSRAAEAKSPHGKISVLDYQQAPFSPILGPYSSDGIFKGCTSKVSEELGTIASSAKSNSGQIESDLQPHSVNVAGTLNLPPKF